MAITFLTNEDEKKYVQSINGIIPDPETGDIQITIPDSGRNVCAKAQEIREKNFCVISNGTTATNGHPNTAAHEYESTFIEAWLRML